jgi:hypothetical protein
VNERKYAHLVKPKHQLTFSPKGGKLSRVHVGFWEGRDVHGTEAHWRWLIWKWTREADKLYAQESRGVFK